jgi:CRISPR/Cas system-associated exonuclease Cas4 (RecB family)
MAKINKSHILTHRIEKYLIDKAIKEAERRFNYSKTTLSPSTDFACQKRAYLSIKHSGPKALPINEKDFSYTNEIAKDAGNAYHLLIQKYFSEMNIVRLNETTFEDEKLKIKSRIDNLIEIDNQLYLVEIKSVKSYAIHMMESEGAINGEHLKQVNCYFHLLDLNKDREDISKILNGRTVTKCILLYINKNDQKLSEYVVDKDNDLIDEIIRYSKFVWKSVEDNEEPKTPFSPEDYECTYCPFYLYCHGKPKPEKLISRSEDKDVWGSVYSKPTKNEPQF